MKQLPFSVEAVVEESLQTIELRLRYGSSYERTSPQPLVLMTQRRRLDAFLAEQALGSRRGFPRRDPRAERRARERERRSGPRRRRQASRDAF